MNSKLSIILLLQIFVINTCTGQKVDNWSNFKDTLMSKYDNNFADNGSKKIFTDCVIEKFNRNYPNGAKGLSQAKLNDLARTYGATCSDQLKGLIHFRVSWSSSVGKNLKKMLMKSPVVFNISDNDKSSFCDCFLLKIKNRYPNGINEIIPKSFQDSAYILCKKELNIR